MKNLSAAYKGLITGFLIILLSGIVYYSVGNFDNPIALAAYAIYALGILWTLYGFYKSTEENKSLGQFFGQGFRCFIVVTLLMVCANWLFLKLNASFRNEMIAYQRELLIQNKDYTPVDVETQVANFTKMIIPSYTMSVILSYLGVGTLITLFGSVFFTIIKKNK